MFIVVLPAYLCTFFYTQLARLLICNRDKRVEETENSTDFEWRWLKGKLSIRRYGSLKIKDILLDPVASNTIDENGVAALEGTSRI